MPTDLDHYRQTRRTRTLAKVLAVLIGAAVVGGAVGFTSSQIDIGMQTTGEVVTYADTISDCSITDGDTIRCGGERIRLLGIDAPELAGHCRRGRVCAPGDAEASTASLRSAVQGSLTINRVGEDRYGRTLALVAGKHGDLSCWQLQHGQAIYKPKWDDGFRVARTCPTAAV